MSRMAEGVEPPYPQLANTLMEMGERAEITTAWMPHIYTHLEATLTVCSTPGYSPGEGSTVAERSEHAQATAHTIASTARTVIHAAFSDFEAKHPGIYTPGSISPSMPETSAGFTVAAIMDAAFVAGGALQALRKHGYEGLASEVLANSRRLMLYGLAGEGKTISPTDLLRDKSDPQGYDAPYADPTRFVVTERDGNLRVEFEPRTHQAMRLLHQSSPERGCPAAMVAHGSGGNVLGYSWTRLMNYLAPTDVTV